MGALRTERKKGGGRPVLEGPVVSILNGNLNKESRSEAPCVYVPSLFALILCLIRIKKGFLEGKDERGEGDKKRPRRSRSGRRLAKDANHEVLLLAVGAALENGHRQRSKKEHEAYQEPQAGQDKGDHVGTDRLLDHVKALPLEDVSGAGQIASYGTRG